MIEGGTVYQTEMRHALAEFRSERLRDTTADSVSDDACALDPKLIEELDDARRVSVDVRLAVQWPVAATKAEQVEHDESVSGGNEWDDIPPQMT